MSKYCSLAGRGVAQVASSASVSSGALSVNAHSQNSSGTERAAVVVRVAQVSGGADTVHAGTGRVSGGASAAVVVRGAEVSLAAETTDARSHCRSTRAGGCKGVGGAAASLHANCLQGVHLALGSGRARGIAANRATELTLSSGHGDVGTAGFGAIGSVGCVLCMDDHDEGSCAEESNGEEESLHYFEREEDTGLGCYLQE
ncbi:hypothetical protein PMAYCL1PPCAC_28527, partial [Pristionchus mayeri]